ncbi:MAG: DUF5665 domain-containing protein [Candidatus Peribacteraceae bacterium]|jgi:hypothetical protein
MPTPPSTEKQLIKSIDELNATLRLFLGQRTILGRPTKVLGLYFLRGVLYGVGILFTIVIIVPIIIWLLHWIEWVPLLGDFLAQVVARMEQAMQLR